MSDQTEQTPIAPTNDTAAPAPIPFLIVHLICLAAFFTGITWQSLAIFVVFYVVRMFGITAGYHRYFAHKSFKTGRIFQFILAFLAQASAQRGALWWAGKHRAHHRHSDTEHDVHSPVVTSFWYAHLGWIFEPRNHTTDYNAVRDWLVYPEIVWLDRNPFLAPTLFGIASFLIGGWPGLIVGFFWSTVALWHATFMINSLAHVYGKRRFVTGDQSRNNWMLAVVTLGEGWHNNHHAFQASCRQGFKWWEVDVTFAILRALSWVGIVKDIRHPPKELVQGIHTPGPAILDKAALDLAKAFESFLARHPQIARTIAEARDASHAQLEAMRAFARRRLPKRTPHLDEIVETAVRMMQQMQVANGGLAR